MSSPISTSSLLTLLPDSTTRGAHFLNVTARVQDGNLKFTGLYDAAELLPVLLFSVGVPWIEPCVQNVCCLWEVASRYRDNDLLTALGSVNCNEHLNFTGLRLMKGSNVESVDNGSSTLQRWDLTTRIHPNFVIMLFLCLSPVFYMYYEVVPVQWIKRRSVTWNSAWYGDLCHTVTYPDGREVCIHCSNPKPQHSAYVFSAEWFQTFECRWICDPGYTGPNCEVAVDTALYAAGGMFVVMCVSGILLVAMYGRNLGTLRMAKKVVTVQDEEVEKGSTTKVIASSKFDQAALTSPVQLQSVATPRTAGVVRSEIITFKDNSSALSEIRIKLL